MCIFCLVCSAHAVIFSSIRSSQQIQNNPNIQILQLALTVRLGGTSETAYGHATVLPPYTVRAQNISAFRGSLCFPVKKSRLEKRTVSTGENGKWLTFVAARIVFMPYAGEIEGGGALDQ